MRHHEIGEGSLTNRFITDIKSRLTGSKEPVVEYKLPTLRPGETLVIKHHGKVWLELEKDVYSCLVTLRLNTITDKDMMEAVSID